MIAGPDAAEIEAGAQDVEHAVTDLVQHVEGPLATAVGHMRTDLRQIRGLVGDATSTLQGAFRGLNERTTGQLGMASTMISKMRNDDDTGIAMTGFAEETDEVLRHFVDYAVNTSANSMAMVERIDDMVEHMGHADSLLGDVKVDEIRSVIGQSIRAIDGARGAIQQLASQDMNFAIQAKTRVNAMLEHLTELNQSAELNLDEVSRISIGVNGRVGDAVRSLQFEDIVRQLAAYSERHLDRVHGLVNQIHGGLQELHRTEQRAPRRFIQVLRRLQFDLDQFIAAEMAADNKPVAQASMAEGDVERF